MKTDLKRWLPLFLVAISFVFLSCNGNNPDDDLEGIITIKMRNDESTWINLPGISCVAMSSANNFIVWPGEHGDLHVGITDVGKKRLSQVTSLPSSGWVYQIAVQLNHCYIYKLEDYGYERKNYYLKIYVKDWIKSTSGGIIGAEVQYCEWNPK